MAEAELDHLTQHANIWHGAVPTRENTPELVDPRQIPLILLSEQRIESLGARHLDEIGRVRCAVGT